MSDAKGKTMTDQDTSPEAVERFITQYESGQQGCHMDADDAQAFAATLRTALATQSAPEITEEMVERAVAAALPELQRREAVMADPMTLDLLQTRRIVRAALTAALAPDPSRSPDDDKPT